MNNNTTGDPRDIHSNLAKISQPYYTTTTTNVNLGNYGGEIIITRDGKNYNVLDMLISNERKMRSVCKIMRENKLCEKCELKMECLFE